MMEPIDNRTRLLGDDLRKELRSGSKVSIIASYFSIYAFEALKDELERIEELRFIFPAVTFVDEGIKGTVRKEAKEFYIPKQLRENALYGTEFEIRLRNRLQQRAIARECADWVRRKVRFRSNMSNQGMSMFIHVDNGPEQVAYNPVPGFSASDLGYEQSNMAIQAIVKQTELPAVTSYLSNFNRIWNDDRMLQDVTDSIITYIATAYKDNAPDFIYFLTLYNIFSEFLHDELLADDFPNELTGYQDSLIWRKLFTFQKDGAIGVINKLERYNGCILADSVGLGKTFTALAVMKYYSARNKNILVLAPKRLAENWNRYRNNTKTNIFLSDRIRYDVLYHTDLGRTRGFSNGIDLRNFNWDNYDLLVIDESHYFRNRRSYRSRATRYEFLVDRVLRPGVKTKVLMLTATPVNNRFNDLKNQIALAYEGSDPQEFNARLETRSSVGEILRQAQEAYNEWTKLPEQQRNARELMSSLDLDFSILLDNVTIARSRKHIMKYYDSQEIGSFPERLAPLSFYCGIAREEDCVSYKSIYEELMRLTMAVYAPTDYLQPSKIGKYEELYDITVPGKATLKQANREKALQRLMTINMLKRLESCVDSFRLTLKKVRNTSAMTLAAIEQAELNGFRDKAELTAVEIDEDELDDDEEIELVEATMGKIKIDFRDMDLRRFKNDLRHDVEALDAIHEIMTAITPAKDLKLQKLLEVITDKIEHPINPGNRKILIFSAFADTTNYLYEHVSGYLKRTYGLESAKIQGVSNGNRATIPGERDTDRLLTMFAPLANERDLIYPNEKYDIDVLIATDCVSEGQNLQDCDYCINYDIHWNPVRIVQRFGRIDRIGSVNRCIRLVNFWPDLSLDEYINLNRRVASRMVIVDLTATADDNILREEKNDLNYRAVQLRKLREGRLQDLEDVEGQITITDLGLNEFRMDLVQYLKKEGEPKNVPHGLYAVVPAAPKKGIEPGVIYVLRNRNAAINIERRNRLHPYYLLYLKEDGTLLVPHDDPKRILDILRSTCKYHQEPLKDLCARVNHETKDGYDMTKYSALLNAAVAAIIRRREQNDLAAVFRDGAAPLFERGIIGLDDFELITFVVVK